MTDLLDSAQEQIEATTEAAIRAHAERPRSVGRAQCEDPDCGEPITPQRQALGARLCLACQKAEEGRQAHFAKWHAR